MAITTERQTALTDIIQAINSTLNTDEILRIVMDNIIRLVKAERGFLMLRNKQGEFTTRIARNWEQESLDPSEFAVSRSVIHRVVAEGRPVLTTNAKEDPRFGAQESIIIYNLRSILCVPLKVKGELTGVIYVDNRIHEGIFTENELDLLLTFANHAAVALENARLFDSVRRTLAEVTELKNLMDNVFASIASGVITTDNHHKILLCNRAAKDILGQNGQNVIGLCLDDMLMPAVGVNNAEEISREIDLVRTTNRSIVGREYTFNRPLRGPVSLSLNLSPLKDAQSTTQGVAIVVDDLTEKKRLEAERRLFERMVSPAVIRQLDPDQLQLGGKRSQITVLFADIRGFTQFSEQVEPETLVSVLNRYLAAAAEAVLAQEGTIDKFMGDAVMAWFNAPIPQEDHTLRAVRAALGIRAAVQRLTYELPPEFHLHFGAGIHLGDAVLGLVGTEKRMEYTAIGDSVNVAKRIQENAAANQILVSEAAYRLVANRVETRPSEPIQAKGKRDPIPVYEVIGLKP
ncbi:MAG: adenylate/guanylate cyclase domain-containing protein [Anaerolineales bacterium]|jgi:PAS domain S-box-containing protein|nr:adenylate/guanylate cyclase domain-containing protein [Anaerolineales bacterium]